MHQGLIQPYPQIPIFLINFCGRDMANVVLCNDETGDVGECDALHLPMICTCIAALEACTWVGFGLVSCM